MRAFLRLAARRKPLSRRFLCQRRSFVLSHVIDIQHKTSTSLRHCSTDAAAEIHESDEFVEGLDAEEKATADVSILLNRLNSGLKSGLMKSHSILQNVEFLTSNGCVIPSSIFLNAADILAKRKEPHLIENLLQLVRLNSQSFSVDPDPNYQAALQREKSPAYEYSKIAAFGIKKLLRHSTGDALTLWNHITVDGFKASRADLIEMLKEIADSELLPDIALTLKITALMQQNAWNNSADYYRGILSVYRSYVERKNKQSLPALITVCNYFDRTFFEYERRIAVSNGIMGTIDGTSNEDKPQSRSVAGMGPGSGRRRAELPALDEEIHALRASFWAAAYSASSNMRHVKGVDGRPSGEDVYATCRRRAFGHHNSFASQGESEVKGEENPLLSKESNFKFKMLSGLLADLQKGFRQDKLVSTDLTTLGSRISSLSTLLAEQNSVSSIGSNISVDVAYNHVEVEDRIQVKEIPRLPHRYPGRSKVVHPPKSEYSVEGLASYEASDPEPDLDEAAGQEVQPETYIRKDFDIFRNNCRVNEMSKLNDEGWNENMKSETTLEIERQSDRERNGIYASGAGSSSSGAVGQDWDAQVTLDKRVEGTLRRASRNLICHLAGTCYHPPNQDQLLLQLDGFLKNSKRSRTFNKIDNDGVIEELLGEVLKAARFNKPLRPAYLYRPRAAHDLAEVPEFYQQYVPALPDDCYSAFDMTLEQVAKRQIFMEEKNLKKGELDSSNRFCDVALLRNHIEKVDELAEILQAWAQENDVSLKNDFLAGWVAAYVRPGHSNVYFKKNMDRPKSDYDWRLAYDAAKGLIASRGAEEDVYTPQVYHSLIRILCDHSNSNAESLRLAYDMTTKEIYEKGMKPLPETYAVIIKGAVQILDDVDLKEFIKPAEKFAGLEYEGRVGHRLRLGPPPLNNTVLLQELLTAHSRIKHSYQCLFLMHNLRALQSRIPLSQIASVSTTIALVDFRDRDQQEVTDMLSGDESRADLLCDFIMQETRRWGYAVDHILLLHVLDIQRSRLLAARRIDRKSTSRAKTINLADKDGPKLLCPAYDTHKAMDRSCEEMVRFVTKHVNLESEEPEDKVKKQWILRAVTQMYLSIQFMRDAHVVLKDITETHKLEPHNRYYDPFLNYYCVRGRVDRFNEMFQAMLNQGLKPSHKIAEQALTCYIIAHFKGQIDVGQISDKVQEMYNAYRVRPSSSGMVRLIDYLIYIGDEQEARRTVVLIEQLFTERERETEINWPSRLTPTVFFKMKFFHSMEEFSRVFAKKGPVYRNGPYRGEAGLLTADSLEERFRKAGFELYPSPTPPEHE